MASEFEVPVAKRPKLEAPPSLKRNGSRLFTPFRTIGLVSPTDVPFTAVPLGKSTFQITTSVGRSLQTYDLRRGLNLVFLSRPRCPAVITATCAYRDRVFVAWGSDQSNCGSGVWVFKRGRHVATFDTATTSPQGIQKLLVLGNWIVGCGRKTVEIWKNDSYEHYTTLTPTRPALIEDAILSGAVCSLPTFLNKIFVGRVDGAVEIYNVSTGKLLHTILPNSASAGPVTALSSTTALSMLAIAYADGSLTIVDVETEDVVTTLRQSNSDRPVTSISFRSDGTGAGDDGRLDGVLATASIESGDVTFWDLTKGGKVAGILRGAHQTSSTQQSSGISAVEFLPGQPVLVSSGVDNSLKTWVFDHAPFSAIPRILHSRSGHAAPISTLKFLPAASDGSDTAGKWLLSASQDRSLWGFSLRRDGQSTELSQGNVKHKAKKSGKMFDDQSHIEDLKCPPIKAIACSLNRDGGMGAVGGPVWANPSVTKTEESNLTGWESMVTAHEDDKFARTWFWGRKKAGRWAFESGDQKPVSTVTITACGTFAIVGSAGGAIDTFNLQSGAHRQRFPPRLTPSQAKQLKSQLIQQEGQSLFPRGHSASVTGLVVDNMNRNLVSTALDGQVIFWDFVSGKLVHRLNLDGCSVTAVKYNPVSGLVSMACDDLCVRVVDVETKRIVRELWGSVGQIYDHCFSHDGRWIVTSSMDSIVRVFDLPTGHLIDAFKAGTCTNLAFSSTGEYLATAHAGEIGVNIWNNKSLYTHISSRQVDEDTETIDLTEELDFDGAITLATEDEMSSNTEINGIDTDPTMEQLDESLLTLSLVPSSKWQTLLNLESIRQRNKPILPPQKPKAAPFFLGSALMDGTTNHVEEEPTRQNLKGLEEDKSRISRLTSLQPAESEFSSRLQQFSSQNEHDPSELIEHLASLSPSAADLEIRSLSIQEMPTFIQALISRLRQRRDFELVNTWMAVFLKVHSEFVGEVEDVQEAVLEFQRVMNMEEVRLSRSVGWARGVVEFLRSAR